MIKDTWVAYVGPFLFPWGQAGSRRVYGIAKSLVESGVKVIVAGGSHEPAALAALEDGAVSGGSLWHIGLGELPRPGSSYPVKVWKLFVDSGARTVKWLSAMPTKPTHLVVYGQSAPFMLRVFRWCRRNDVKIIVDIVEWYDPSQMKGGRFGPFYISAKLAMHFFFPRCDGIIAISSLLAEHYSAKMCKVIRIPPTLDVQRVALVPQGQRKSRPRRLELVYAGTPGKKDLLRSIALGIAEVDPHGTHVHLVVLGPSQEEVGEILGGSEAPAFMDVLGMVPQIDVAEVLASADFSVLLRAPLRFAQAGFPTKFVESMASGTPVIGNLTSDLGKYFHDGVEGLVCKDHSPNAFADTLRRALSLSSAELNAMKVAARNRAINSFDFRVYSRALRNFIENTT